MNHRPELMIDDFTRAESTILHHQCLIGDGFKVEDLLSGFLPNDTTVRLSP